MIGRTISHYRIIEKLGEGGMGVVYIAEDTTLARQVAIKFLSSLGPKYRTRFLREARAASALSHPNIAAVYDYGETEDDYPYIVMELVKGKPLSELLEKEPLSMVRALEIVAGIASALGEAHHHGIVHRDVKPSNIMISERDQVKVLDFGLVKQLSDHVHSDGNPDAPTLLSSHTRSNIIVGTPLYLSPEQALGKPVDGRSDLFALGALLYECLTGKSAFSGSSVIEIGAQVIHVNPPPPSQINPLISAELDRITMKAMEKEVEARYQSVQEFLTDLRAVLPRLSNDGELTQRLPLRSSARSSALHTLSATFRRPRFSVGFFIITLAVIVTLIAGAILWWRPAPHKPSEAAQRLYDRGTEALREGAYYQASSLLEQAISVDDKFALAHARLAETWAELDYTDKAKDELLRAKDLVPDPSVYPQLERLYLTAITATVTADFERAVEAYHDIARLAPDQPRVYVDLGRAYEKADNTQKAIEAYIEATNRDSQYPVPFLRVGYLYGRQQDLASANAAFNKAEQLFDSLRNVEGRGEVLFQRGSLMNNLGRAAEAREKLQQALDISAVSRNQSLRIKTLMQLSGVVYDLGDSEKAREYAREGVELARATGMENLTARGLVDLGYAYLNSGDYPEAERYFNQALEFANRYKSRRNEARTLFALASLRERQGNSDAVIRLLEPVLAFYQGAGFRSEALSCLTLLGRAKRNKGDYDGARELFQQQLDLSLKSGDQSQLALAHEGLGNVLNYQENYFEALGHFDEKYAIAKASGRQISVAYSLLSRGEMLFQLGRYEEAAYAISEADSIAKAIKGGDRRLLAEVYLLRARMTLTERKFPETKANCQKAIEASGQQSEEVLAWAKYVLGFAQGSSGQGRTGQQTSREALEIAEKLNNQWLRLASMQALAQSQLASEDAKGALETAIQARALFSRSGQKDSEWRTLLIASLASLRLNDSEGAHKLAGAADEVLSQLTSKWSKETVNGFLSRPDVRFLKRQLGDLTAQK
ncbi:MAG TPA: tetratricopeptide repeat protein [Pyrinomonadaceae bacterium]|nr:tetratricopeptide repeat protein [Pyrinomonadaceae bacterium]